MIDLIAEDEAHREDIETQVVLSLMDNGIGKTTALKIVRLLADGAVENVRLIYRNFPLQRGF